MATIKDVASLAGVSTA
ncbi:LacI family DNA-binding transcriptional regulator, partial [Salmonella enterica subsp. enterica serovar Irumu]|nr:LacI family DNA-binding transcriptional regulator [Salmonella enterica subsp. enterica serovar Irumu]